MSHVTNIIILCPHSGKDIVEELNKWLEDNYYSEQYARTVEKDSKKYKDLFFKAVHDRTGGNKAFESLAFMGAFNYLPLSEFVEKVRIERSNFWESPMFQVFIKDEHEDSFWLVMSKEEIEKMEKWNLEKNQVETKG